MWSMLASNRKCNEHERIYQHKSHLERIVNSKSALDRQEPKKPSFLFRNCKKAQEEKTKNIKIHYENGLIIKKIIHLETHNMEYHPKNIKIKYCPAFDKTLAKDFQKKFINRENYKFSQRLVSAKPVLNTKASLDDYHKNKYFENMISRTKNNVNPNLNFVTPLSFRKNLDGYVGKLMGQTSNLRTVTNKSSQRPISSNTLTSFFPKVHSKTEF